MPLSPDNSPLADQIAERLKVIRETLLKHRPTDVSKIPDLQSIAEERTLEAQKQIAEIGGAVQDIKERKKYAHRSFCLVVIWLFSIGVVIILQGFKIRGFNLEPQVLMARIGGTTTGIVGIFLIVSRYLFPRRK